MSVIHGTDIVTECYKYLGVPYKFGAEVTAPAVPARWDCSEYVQYVLTALGMENVPDGSWNQYAWCGRHALVRTIDQVRGIPGCLVFMRHPDSKKIHHVAFTDGMNNTIEARGSELGTGVWPWRTGWSDAGMIPGVFYRSE